jgi:hypothetical protein
MIAFQNQSRKRQSGMSMAEVLVGLLLVGVTILASLTVVNGALTGTRNNMDKQFATQKAIAMLEELRALIQGTQNANATVLDDYDDGIVTQSVLTTQLVPSGTIMVQPAPDSPLSGNTSAGGTDWIYARKITVQTLPSLQAANVRLVRVQVFKNTPQGQRLLAEVASVLSATVTPFPPTQVYDVYAIGAENVPGWWVFMSNLIPFVEGSIQDLQARNPGLQYRVHWIRRLAYGRDQMYTPFINTTTPSTNQINSVYFYPGLMPANSADDFYYPPSYFAARMNFDGTVRNGYDATVGSATYNPAPYALADQYNHAMRVPAARELFNARVAAGLDTADTPPLHLLIDDMYTNPDQYRNAILINLHGELMPFPPVRNYSDPAKIPDVLPNVRVVTHPEQLRYDEDDPVRLRVYSYLLDPAGALPVANPNPWLQRPITITLKDIVWNPAPGDIQAVVGGTNQDLIPGAEDYARVNAPTFTVANEMYYESSIVGNDTIIKLFNSPLRSPCMPTPVLCTNGGLFHANDSTTRRLYGLEYIPSPVEDLTPNIVAPNPPTTPFVEDLATPGDFPKNTARWIIRIPNANLDATCSPACGNVNRRIDIETKIGDNPDAGTVYPAPIEPANRSVTYAWHGDDDWIFGTPASAGNPATPANLPWTERFQFIGDPRHLPYADLKRPHVGSGRGVNENPLGLGYNSYFDDFEEGYDPSVAGTEPDENYLAAEMIGTQEGPYNIINANRVFSIRVNGGGTININLTTGGARTPAQVVANLMASGAFTAVARATVFGNRVRIAALQDNSALWFQTATANNSSAVLGFDGAVHTRSAWEGWKYTVGATPYGVKNNEQPHDDGWTSGGRDQIEFDMTRVSQAVRAPLQRANALWTTLTGWSYYYIGIGNEIGYDAQNGFPNSIPVSNRPFTGAAGSGFEQSIIDTGGNAGLPISGVKYVKEDVVGGWWAMTWLGEMYPDNMFDNGTGNDWLNTGNLPTGSGANTFRRVVRNAIPSTLYSSFDMPGTSFKRFTPGGGSTDTIATTRRTAGFGSTNFMWSGTAANSFRHEGWGNADLSTRMADGAEVASRYSMPVPTTMPTARPFGINIGGATPDNFLSAAYGPSNRIGVLAEFFRFQPDANLDGSSLVAVVNPTIPPAPAPAQPTDVMYVVGNGLSPAGAAGNAFIGRWSLLTLIHSYFVAGQFSYTAPNTINITSAPTAVSRVRQLPQVAITNPNLQTQLGSNPSNINITWAVQWRRWDGSTYTNSYNALALALDAAIPLSHRVMYSIDNGRNWLHASDDSPATPGTRPAAAYLQGGTAFNWDVSNAVQFPKGNYLIRIETYREGLPLHYSYHQFQAFIDR